MGEGFFRSTEGKERNSGTHRRINDIDKIACTRTQIRGMGRNGEMERQVEWGWDVGYREEVRKCEGKVSEGIWQKREVKDKRMARQVGQVRGLGCCTRYY